MTRRHGFALPLLLALATCAATPVASAEQHGDTLTEKDVVLRFAAGATESELLALVREHDDVAFDLSPEMLDELRLAGLPEAVLQAMHSRAWQAEPAPPGRAESEDPELPVLTVTWMASEEGAQTVRLPAVAPEGLAEQLRLTAEETRITAAAIVLLCRTQDHVPDHWRSQSVLGRDFYGTQRHRLLAFHSSAGAETTPDPDATRGKGSPTAARGPRWLDLPLPDALRVELTPGVAHDLSLGVAIEVAGRFVLVREDRLDGLVLDGDLEIAAEVIERGADGGPQIRFAPR